MSRESQRWISTLLKPTIFLGLGIVMGVFGIIIGGNAVGHNPYDEVELGIALAVMGSGFVVGAAILAHSQSNE